MFHDVPVKKAKIYVVIEVQTAGNISLIVQNLKKAGFAVARVKENSDN